MDENLQCKVVNFEGVLKGIAVPEEHVGYLRNEFLALGQEFLDIAPDQPPDPKDDGYCFDHARAVALGSSGELRYVEGLGGSPSGERPVSGTTCEVYECFPHAWCVNRQGQVVDPGWPAHDSRYYFGIPIPMVHVEKLQAAIDADPSQVESPVLVFRYLSGVLQSHLLAMKEYEDWRNTKS